jgi:20S proteasome alpha/beta subunit
VTVCVATMCRLELEGVVFPLVIGTSDRMLTYGDVQFEPQAPKIVRLAHSVAVMTAGDIGVHAEIISGVRVDVTEWIAANPGKAISVEDVARAYSRRYNELKVRRAEQAILAPLGLSAGAFLNGEVAGELASELMEQMQRFRELGIEAIVGGVDSLGAHIFTLDNGRIYCADRVGFASVGAGYWHANSHLMGINHTATRAFPETLFHTFYAKRRAEIAPGVGTETDMFIAGAAVNGYMDVIPAMLSGLGAMYDGAEEGVKKASATVMPQFHEALMKPLRETARKAMERVGRPPEEPDSSA